MNRLAVCAGLTLSFLFVAECRSAEIVRITAENYPAILPKGKETDAIIGDYIIRNEQIVAVIADTVATRKANMTTPQVGGCVIDLTRRERENDQLTAYYPGGLTQPYEKLKVEKEAGEEVVLRCRSARSAAGIVYSLAYRLRDGDDWLTVVRAIRNTGEAAARVTLLDTLRAETTFEKVPNGPAGLVVAHDNWFRQSYGLLTNNVGMVTQSDARNSSIFYTKDGNRSIELKPNESFVIETKVFPAENAAALAGIVAKIKGQQTRSAVVKATETGGAAVEQALVTIKSESNEIKLARTDGEGMARLVSPLGKYSVTVSHPARGDSQASLDLSATGAAVNLSFELPVAPRFVAKITDADGQPLPCKVQFIGIDGTATPNFGPNTQGPGVTNLYFSHNGSFTWPVPAGKYRVLVSYGTEYDLVDRTIEMKPGAMTKFEATLHRSVQTPGWVSTELHTHSTPSGDNVTEMRARVLTLLAEQLEFSPCTEHNRLDTFVPVLKELGCEKLMATCTGMELTGSPLPLNHQNAFPLVYRPGLQDNGGPATDVDPEVQIRRLAQWDNNAEKLIQTNHPDLGWMFFDRDGNGERDAGFYRMFAFQDVIEIWGNSPIAMTDETILSVGPITKRERNNRLFNWLQLLNQGYHVVGVGNSDGHYTDHGVGWIRNYVKSSTDDPAAIKTEEMVRAHEAGHVIVTNGPYLEVELATGDRKAIAGDSVVVVDGKAKVQVRVQCPNWFDIDRVQFLINGRQEPKYNFTRKSHPGMFTGDVVKFNQTIDFELKEDSHLIVVATGEGLTFGDVMGPANKEMAPTAFCNPIYLDIDGKGFVANGDTLGHPLPIKADTRAELQRLIRERATQKKEATPKSP